jgi:uncharacterized cupredoxin-like copper-binding protein
MPRFRTVLAVACVALVAAVGFSTSSLAAPAAQKATVTVNVSAGEFFFKLSKSAVKVGTTVVFKVKNVGQVAHDFKLTGYKKTPLLEPGQSASFKVTFRKKGRIQYLCTVPRHAEQGMAGAFVVK